MKYLTIIRHAKSDWENPDLDDIARPLNERGKNAIVLVGNKLYNQKIQPDLIISSPATRALETARGIAKLIKYDLKTIQVEPVVYFGTSSAVIEMLKEINNKYQDVMLFGHEPILSSLIFLLSKTSLDKFPTCSVFRIGLNSDRWLTIKEGHKELFITPKQLMV